MTYSYKTCHCVIVSEELHRTERYSGMEVYLHIFLTLVVPLGGYESLASLRGRFTPDERTPVQSGRKAREGVWA
jgi:hypothetical protein